MPSFLTLDELYARAGGKARVQRLAPQAAGGVDEAAITTAITTAEQEAASYLTTRYPTQLPTAPGGAPDVLKSAVAQRLIPTAVGTGRAPAVEVLISTAFIKDCIVDKDKTHMIQGAIAQGTSQYGMQTFDQSIFSLFSQGKVTLEEALKWATNVDEFKLKVQGVSTTSDMSRDQMASSVFGKSDSSSSAGLRKRETISTRKG